MARKAGRRGKGEGSILHRSDGRWVAQVQTGFKEDGRPKYAQRSARTQREAVEKLDALKREIFSGVYTDTKVTVKAYMDEWLETKEAQVAPKTLEGYTRTAKHIVRHLGGERLSKLSSQQIQRALSAIRDESAEVVKERNKGVAKAGAGVRTANQCRTNLHTALEDAVTAVPPILMRNPVAATRTLQAESEEVVIWTPDQMATFLEVARDNSFYPLFVLAFGSGLRRGELLGLRWKDIGVSSVSVQQAVKLESNRVVVGSPKTPSARRRVPVGKDVMAALDPHREAQAAHRRKIEGAYEDHGLVFATALGKPLHPRNLERTWYALQSKTREHIPNLPLGGLHTLRHFYASSSIHAGVNSKTLSKRMGHTTVRLTLDRYSHIWEEVEAESEGLDISGLLRRGQL